MNMSQALLNTNPNQPIHKTRDKKEVRAQYKEMFHKGKAAVAQWEDSEDPPDINYMDYLPHFITPGGGRRERQADSKTIKRSVDKLWCVNNGFSEHARDTIGPVGSPIVVTNWRDYKFARDVFGPDFLVYPSYMRRERSGYVEKKDLGFPTMKRKRRTPPLFNLVQNILDYTHNM